MSSLTLNHWLFATSGVLVGGLVIRYIGFYNTPSSHRGMGRFYKMSLCLQGGVAVTAISTVILKLSRVSRYFEYFPKLALFGSIIGLIKFYPSLRLRDEDESHVKRNIASCVVFWCMPSIYYCVFDYKALQTSLLCSVYLLTICFTIGTTIPLKNAIVSDVGLKVTLTGTCVFFLSILCCMVKTPPTIVLNTSLIVAISGIVIDDLQHLKLKYIVDDEDESMIRLNPLKKSLPIFLESAIMFGRLAVLVGIFTEEKMNERQSIE